MNDHTDSSSLSASPVFVYFISAGAAPIKFGLSDDPEARLSDLQTAHYRKLHLLYTIECANRDHARELESAFHRWYDDKRLLNEWFDLVPSKVAADLHLLITLVKTLITVRQHIDPSALQRMEEKATVRQQLNRAFGVQTKVFAHLDANPQDADLSSRELAAQVGGVGHDAVNKAKKLWLKQRESEAAS